MAQIANQTVPCAYAMDYWHHVGFSTCAALSGISGVFVRILYHWIHCRIWFHFSLILPNELTIEGLSRFCLWKIALYLLSWFAHVIVSFHYLALCNAVGEYNFNPVFCMPGWQIIMKFNLELFLQLLILVITWYTSVEFVLELHQPQ